MNNKEGAERRRHERYELKDRIFVAFRPHLDRIGWLIDISKGGVSLNYSDVADCAPLTENVVVDIFSAPKNIQLLHLPCKLVYDSRVDGGKGFIEIIETRRSGLAFGSLSQIQTDQLDDALKKCTVGDAGENMAFHQLQAHKSSWV